MIEQQSLIEQVDIIGLHGDRNISLRFDEPIKILVDENGSGKTTFLNIVVGLLQGKWHQVLRYEFAQILLSFSSGKKVNFTKDDFNFELESVTEPAIAKALTKLPSEVVMRLFDEIRRYSYTQTRQRGLLDSVADEVGMHPRLLYESIQRGERSLWNLRNRIAHQQSFDFVNEDNKQLLQKSSQLTELFPYRILYFPTYRLVEENLHTLGYEDQIHQRSEQLIQFGMQDVSRRWNSITDDIRRSAIQWFSKINGRMLNELTGGIREDTIDYKAIQNSKALEIVLARSGDNISNSSKTRIMELVNSGEISGTEFVSLAYFLSNLIKIYEQQQSRDNAIKQFVNVVNQYLGDKEILYDETELEIKVLNSRSQKPMPLDKLSSGEKQIVSIFSKLYLELDNPKPYAIFFDEPELSLSMEWQKKLLEDITNTDQCVFLLAATHSPFIFENNLASYADVLQVQFVE